MNYKNYPNVNTSLLIRLWKYKNRNDIKEPVLIFSKYGEEVQLKHTAYGTLMLVAGFISLIKI